MIKINVDLILMYAVAGTVLGLILGVALFANKLLFLGKAAYNSSPEISLCGLASIFFVSNYNINHHLVGVVWGLCMTIVIFGQMYHIRTLWKKEIGVSMKFSAWWLMLASPLIIWLGYGMGKLFGGPYRASSGAKRDIAGDGSYSSWSHADSACDSDGGTNGGDCGDGGDGGGD